VEDRLINSEPPRAGYTLPVFACAAAIAALRHLQELRPIPDVAVDLLEPAEIVTIPIEQVALIHPNAALAITRSDPGDNLDLTRNTPVWAVVEWGTAEQADAIAIEGGAGIGIRQDGQSAIYAYAESLLRRNLESHRPAFRNLRVQIILPEGRSLAKRTSNEAFGVVEGLSLLGTSGIAQPLSASGQLAEFRQELQVKAKEYDCLVFCIGENGLDLARQTGVQPDRLIKTANWLGSLLVEASLQELSAILLFGYHGKLIKLAGGIFHTHHYVADARLEILTAHCVRAGLPTHELQSILASPTTEAGLQYLQALTQQTGVDWVTAVYSSISEAIDQRTTRYIQAHSERSPQIGTVLFDQKRKIIAKSASGVNLLDQVIARLE